LTQLNASLAAKSPLAKDVASLSYRHLSKYLQAMKKPKKRPTGIPKTKATGSNMRLVAVTICLENAAHQTVAIASAGQIKTKLD
jgi:hypothetical protein